MSAKTMMELPELIKIEKGKTFTLEVRWGVEPILYKPIESISIADGPPRIKITNHGLPDKWPVAFIRVGGMKQLNAKSSPPAESDHHVIRVINQDYFELNDVDAAKFSAYTSGGFAICRTPQNLTGYTARMDVKNKPNGTVLISSDADEAPNNVVIIDVLPSESKIRISITAQNTASLDFSAGVTELEVVGPDGTVDKLKLCQGEHEDPDIVRVFQEVTTNE